MPRRPTPPAEPSHTAVERARVSIASAARVSPEDVPEAAAVDVARGATMPATPVRAGRRPQKRNGAVPGDALDGGNQYRAAVDDERAKSIRDLAIGLRPGTLVRVERMRPSWCAGFLEDVPLGRGGVRELLEYLRDEHGGQLYVVSPLSPRGAPLWDVPLSIGAPPRYRGKVVDRDEWDSIGRARKRGELPEEIRKSDSPEGGWFRWALDMQQQSHDRVLSMMEASTKRTETMIDKITRARPSEATTPRKTLAQELEEVARSADALERVRERLGAGGGGDDEGGGSKYERSRDRMRDAFTFGLMKKFLEGDSSKRQIVRRGNGGPPPGARVVQFPQQQPPMSVQTPPSSSRVREAAPVRDDVPEAVAVPRAVARR